MIHWRIRVRARDVWTLKANAMGVEPTGTAFTSPLGVNTKISPWKRSIFRNSRKSSESS
ncbi:MAG: hypothetical protein Q8N53_07305 [Longimicrobiales bacterium]|nr:hypothetical protein [Longimicrobiales bacterium]